MQVRRGHAKRAGKTVVHDGLAALARFPHGAKHSADRVVSIVWAYSRLHMAMCIVRSQFGRVGRSDEMHLTLMGPMDGLIRLPPLLQTEIKAAGRCARGVREQVGVEHELGTTTKNLRDTVSLLHHVASASPRRGAARPQVRRSLKRGLRPIGHAVPGLVQRLEPNVRLHTAQLISLTGSWPTVDSRKPVPG